MEASRLQLPHFVPPGRERSADSESWCAQLRWLCAATATGFTVPFVGSSLLGLQHDVYLGIYFAAVLALLGAYPSSTRLDVRATLLRHWRLGCLLGLAFGTLLVRNVLRGEATPHPHGAYLAFELLWRGGIYREDRIGAPETGNTIISMPRLLSTNPIGSDRRPHGDACLSGGPQVRDRRTAASARNGAVRHFSVVFHASSAPIH